jgi:zinc-ribbon domain/Domain of unknown function (DUF4352)
MSAFCPQCGAPHDDDARFCPKCGKPLGAAAPLSYSEKYRDTSSLAPPQTPQPVRRSGAVPIAVALIVVAIAAAVALIYIQQQNNKVLNAISSAIASEVGQVAAPSHVFAPPAPSGGLNETAALGENVPIVDAQTNAPVGSQAVVAVKRNASIAYLTPDTGKAFVGVEVRYAATAEMPYTPLHWVVHDQDGAQYTWQGQSLTPALGSGTLAAGRHVTGWIVFEVPKATTHLWADRQNPDGTVIFSVQLY